MKTLEQKIESLLFFKNEPVSFSWLAKTLDIPVATLGDALVMMQPYYENRGIVLVLSDNLAALMTNDIGRELITAISKTEEEKELSKQAMETLSIIAYRGQITKPEIDYIRGVNSMFILRNLLIRGLITKKTKLADKRSPLYIPTHDLLSYIGISSKKQLPQYENISQKLAEIEDRYIKEEESSTEPAELEINNEDR